jgi:hypothetical protein
VSRHIASVGVALVVLAGSTTPAQQGAVVGAGNLTVACGIETVAQEREATREPEPVRPGHVFV